jgi:hypothetical protein
MQPQRTRTRHPSRHRKHRPPFAAQPLEPRTLLATFTVTTDADAGPGSLRQAILDANAAAGADDIHFALPGEGVHAIRPPFGQAQQSIEERGIALRVCKLWLRPAGRDRPLPRVRRADRRRCFRGQPARA